MLNILIHKILSLAMIMGAGFFLVKSGILNGSDCKSISRLTVYLVMPCNIFNAFLMERSGEVVRGLFYVVLGALAVHLFMIALTRLIRRPLRLSPVEQVSLLYTNAGNLIIPLVTAMLGPQWVIYTSAYILVQTLLTWSHGKSLICGEKGMDCRALVTNPNIWAVILGALCFAVNLQPPKLLGDTLASVGSMVGPMAMLVIGMTMGGLQLQKIRGEKRIWLVTVLRLLVYPVLCLGLLTALGRVFPGSAPYFMVTMMAASAPSAALITQICHLYGRDSGYASSICTVTTALCCLTIPLMMGLYLAVTG